MERMQGAQNWPLVYKHSKVKINKGIALGSLGTNEKKGRHVEKRNARGLSRSLFC